MKKQTAKKFFKKKVVNTSSQPKKEAKVLFPKNKRSITEETKRTSIVKGSTKTAHSKSMLYSYIFTVCFLCGIVLLAILLAEQQLTATYTQLQLVRKQRASLAQQIGSWQKVLTKYPGYRDGYFHVAVLEYELGNLKQAQNYNELALTADPNFQAGRELESQLQK